MYHETSETPGTVGTLFTPKKPEITLKTHLLDLILTHF